MVHSSGGMMRETRGQLRGGSGVFIQLVWTVLFVLSTAAMAAMTSTAHAQSGGDARALLSQLQNLQGSGAIDALKGRTSSALDNARQRGSNSIAKFEEDSAAGATMSVQELERRGNLNEDQRPCGSPLEKDYCQRASELLLQYGYDLSGQVATQQALDSGTIFPDYVLGINDELVVTFIGRLNQSISVHVDRKGRILLPNFKPILAAGHTFGQVRREIAARTAAKHLGTDVFVSLGAVRIVKVLVLGEVRDPGRKYITALGTVIDALRLSGGIKKIGSVRRIHVQRGDEVFWIDAYDFLFSGIAARDLTLRDGDRVIVPPIGPTFALTGDVKRPGIYEMAEGRRTMPLAEALEMSGGTIRPRGNKFHHLSFLETGHQKLSEHKNLAAKVQDGDIIRVSRGQNIQLGVVEIEGHVQVQGRRALAVTTSVAKLLGDRNGLRADPYLLFGALETTDPQTQARRLFPLNLQNIIQGREDYALRDNDRLIVLGADDIRFLSSPNVQDVVGRRLNAELRQVEQQSQGDGVAKISVSASALQGTLAGKEILQGACKGMRELLAIVSVNTANRFANAVRTIDTAGLAQINRQDCPKIFDDYRGLLPLALEHVVAVNGEVRRPGAYPVVGNVSLTALIAVAGGLSREVDLTRVEISRYTPNSLKGSSDNARGFVNLAEVGADKVMVGPGDVVRFNPVFTDRDTGPVLLVGEFTRPGLYDIRRGERLSEVIARAGGLTAQAYPYGGIFTRKQVQATQRAGVRRAARELHSALAAVVIQRDVDPSSVLALQRLANQLGSVESLGRVITETDPTVLQVRPELDTVLVPGDRLYMPKRPSFVSVIGDVLSPGAMQFIAGTTADEYISQAGGFQKSADEDGIFVVYPNGHAERLALSVWDYNPVQLPPGSSLVVPKDSAPLDLLTLLREGGALVSQLAITAASLAVINRD